MENSPNLEQEIADIERRLAEKKAVLRQAQGESSPESSSDRAVLHEVVGEKIQELSPQNLPSAAAPPPPAASPSSGGTPSYLSEDLRDTVQQLVNIAFTESLQSAIKAVKKINNPALLDAFHDVLADQLYDALIERGQLEKI